jgi:hypothetical protein
MSNAMQQRGGDQRRIGAGLLGQSGALQRVLELTHPLAAVIGAAALLIYLSDPDLARRDEERNIS